jgi:alginate O-acetyltransferase complex protein AlgI
MELTRPDFAGFFCLVFVVYWNLPRHRWRLLWLLAASCFFYLTWNPLFLLLLFLSTAIDYFVAQRIEASSAPHRRRNLLCVSIALNLGFLAFFKYSIFALDATRDVCNLLGIPLSVPALKFLLPLGISFYTFEAISYVVDVYRHKICAIRDPVDYALYILFFPHLTAGPIVRAGDFLPQLDRRKRFSWPRLQLGVQLYIQGLIKKAVIADHLAAVVDPVFAQPGLYGSQALALAVLGYALQIYCDFSGYSDIAVGLAHTLGFKLPANFRRPYFACGMTDFWRRWHISLSSWLRDYLYVPLGGNRHGALATYRNLLLTMTLGGFWHGARLTFMVWGVYHGLLLVLERALPRPSWLRSAVFRPATVLATFLAVCLGWVFFRAQSLGEAGTILTGLLQPTSGIQLAPGNVGIVWACLTTVFAGHLLGSLAPVRRMEQRLPVPLAGAVLAMALVLFFLLLPATGKHFLYFDY